MIKKFLEEHSHLKIAIQHSRTLGGGFKIQVYNTTWDWAKPIFEHFISDANMANLNVDFETAIMVPIINWWEDSQKRKEATK